MAIIKGDSPKIKELIAELETKHDADSERLKRFLALPDLSRTEGSPIAELITRIKAMPTFKDLDVVESPEIVPADICFDLFNFPPDHPARSRSDTYFVSNDHILRTHTTVMWYYYLMNDEIKKRMAEKKSFGAISYGKVYRKDEIDRRHMNVFHQVDGVYFAHKEDRIITREDLERVLVEVKDAVSSPSVKYRFNPDTFPYTDPSLEMEVDKNGTWVEVLGGGLVQKGVMKKLGMNPDEYTAWAFGFGLERLAIISMELPDIRLLWSKDPRVTKQLKLGQKFVEVSKFPPITRDISFIVTKDFVPNNYFDVIRDIGGDLVEEVELLDKYENAEKFGEGRVSYTYRVIYRSNDRTLTNEEIEPLQDKLYKETAAQFGAEMR